jgi:hypothetical protein
VLIASSVMALALGVAMGALTRRTVMAIFLTLALLMAIRLPVEFGLRPKYQPQITVMWPLDQGPYPPVTLGGEDWHIADGFLDPQGNRIDYAQCTGSAQTPQDSMRAAG